MGDKGTSPIARASLALLLMAGFYLLALAMLSGLGLVIYLEVTSDRISIGITFIAALGFGAIVSGIVPRRQVFVAPGPRVISDEQPRLFEEIRRVADATGSPMPREVYVVPDLNAGVAHIGGFAGIGARPIMMVGLPLIAVLTVSELSGVIAHEFGHYVGGETKLAPVIYRTREAIGRTVLSLMRSPHVFSRMLFYPFALYGRMYLLTTQAISRRQELDADLMAARVAGGDSLERGLVKTHVAGLALDAYMYGELGALLAAGYRPPLVEGFLRFLEGERTTDALQSVDEALRSGTSDPYDSHPSHKERLDALRGTKPRPARHPDPAATELLDNASDLEIDLLPWITSMDVGSLRPVAWDDATSVFLEQWRQRCRDERAALEGITPATLPLVCQDPAAYAARIPPQFGALRFEVFVSLVGAALTVVLSRCGWSIGAGPGDPVTATLDGQVIETFEVLGRLSRDELTAEAWLHTCREAGIADVDLAAAGIQADAEPESASDADGPSEQRAAAMIDQRRS
jgi:heat shock protein HtpX